MKIAFIRLGLPIELDLFSASPFILGTEIRLGLFRDWIKLGYDLTLYSPLKSKDLQFLFNPSLHERWLKNVKYDIQNLPKTEDVLFIEMGVANFMFAYNSGGKRFRYMDRIVDCIANFEGKIIYYQHGILPIPLGSIQSQAQRWHKVDIFKNREWIILHHYLNEEKAKSELPEYKNFPVKFQFIPLGYSNQDPWFEINPEPKWDLIFIGTQWDSASKSKGQTRTAEIKKFYDHPQLLSAVFGKWEAEEVKKFGNIIFFGPTQNHGQAYEIWNRAWGCVWTTSPKIRGWGLVPTRPIMVLRAGGLLLADGSIANINQVVENQFLVNNIEQVIMKLEAQKKLSISDREKIRQSQLHKFPTWDKIKWQKIL